ncbi:uncharacterized protein [Symphalangus syndactylus]|uniref:uncharacterized protein isoform X1 n=1 Tax=Symphalangus syndactylus TaxID=9590 RepID=UPI002442AB2B|nr:uncharacterized protein LOC129459572 isoform X1 [Symphalangus syndactylus]
MQWQEPLELTCLPRPSSKVSPLVFLTHGLHPFPPAPPGSRLDSSRLVYPDTLLKETKDWQQLWSPRRGNGTAARGMLKCPSVPRSVHAVAWCPKADGCDHVCQLLCESVPLGYSQTFTEEGQEQVFFSCTCLTPLIELGPSLSVFCLLLPSPAWFAYFPFSSSPTPSPSSPRYPCWCARYVPRHSSSVKCAAFLWIRVFKNLLKFGQAWWLIPVILALWEAKVGVCGGVGLPEVRSSRPAWPTWRNPISTKNTKISQAWWQAPTSQLLGRLRQENSLNPGGRGCSEPRSRLYSSLGDRVKLSQKKKKKKLLKFKARCGSSCL